MSFIVKLEDQLGRVKFETACFCLTLRTGSLILGCLSFIGGILVIAQAPNDLSEGGLVAFSAGFRIFLGVFWTITAACLLYGVYKSDPTFMLPYIINGIVQFFGNAIDIIFCILTFSFLLLGGVLIAMAIQIYFFLIVSSYYMELRHGASPNTGNNA